MEVRFRCGETVSGRDRSRLHPPCIMDASPAGVRRPLFRRRMPKSEPCRSPQLWRIGRSRGHRCFPAPAGGRGSGTRGGCRAARWQREHESEADCSHHRKTDEGKGVAAGHVEDPTRRDRTDRGTKRAEEQDASEYRAMGHGCRRALRQLAIRP